MKRLLRVLAGGLALAWAGAAVASDSFALRLYGELAASQTGNVAVSPYSVAEAMALAAGGANGATARQIFSTVVPSDVADVPGYFALKNGDWEAQATAGGGHLGVANGIWTTGGAPSESFVDLAAEAYGAKAAALDASDPAQAAETLNAWVSEKTDGMISRLLSAGDLAEAPPIILINAIAFQGFWKCPFDASRTWSTTFTPNDGELGAVPMMRQTGRFALADLGDAQLLRLPYAGDEIEMRIVLPKEGVPLAAVEAQLADSWDDWATQAEFCQVDVQLPRFRLSWGPQDLRTALAALGIHDAFCEKADFSGMGAGVRPGMPLACVVHAAVVDVNEEGTRAAAATGVRVGKSLVRPTNPLLFHANRPFLFAITEASSGSILFIGRVNRPDTFNASPADRGRATPSTPAGACAEEDLSAKSVEPCPTTESEDSP